MFWWRGWFSSSPPKWKQCTYLSCHTNVAPQRKYQLKYSRMWAQAFTQSQIAHFQTLFTCDYPTLQCWCWLRNDCSFPSESEWHGLGLICPTHWYLICSMHWLVLGNSAWKVLCECLRIRKKYKRKNEDFYHFQQADVLCEGGTVSDVMHVWRSLCYQFIFQRTFTAKLSQNARNKSPCNILNPRAALANEKRPLLASRMLIPELWI